MSGPDSPHAPGARFERGGLYYVVVDERLVPHTIGEYVIDRVYVPGHGTLCLCVETGELVRLHRGPHRQDNEGWLCVKEEEPGWADDVPDQSHSPSAEKLLQTLGVRRKP
jgi:hypothetical protein